MKSLPKVESEHRELQAVALALMPLFREKFDYSNKDHHEQHPEMAFEAAKSFMKKSESVFKESHQEWLKEKEKERAILIANGQTGDIVTTPIPNKVQEASE